MRSRYLLIVPVLLLAGCAAGDPFKHTPPSPNTRYEDPRTTKLLHETSPQPSENDTPPLPSGRLDLAKFIDFAQHNNRATKVAWQQARAAAVASGLAAADYFPMLVVLASYGGGYMDLQTSARDNIGNALGSLVPATLVPGVNEITGTGSVVRAGLGDTYTNFLSGAGLRWLLFDFGARDHRNRAAVNDQLAANLRFNATHQKVVFSVTAAYYQLQAANRRQEAAQISKASAQTILESAQAGFDQGLLTEPDLSQVKGAAAQADYDFVTASSMIEVARVNLASTSGIAPGTPFEVAPANFRRISDGLQTTLDEHIQKALRQRPDLLAQASVVLAAEARLRAARAERLPTLALDAIAQYNRFSPTGNNSELFNQVTQEFQNYGGFLTVQWPIFAGFAKENTVRLAETASEAAREELQLMREQVIAEVWKAYVRAKNAVAGREAAIALETACKASYDSSLASFSRGLIPVQDMLKARSAFAQAANLAAEADAAIAESVTALALSSGSL